MRYNIILFSAAIFPLSFAIPKSSFAQARPAINESDAGDIIVTARRKAERLQDVPVAVTALDTKALDERGIRTTDDLRFAVPSLQVSPSPFGSAVPGYTIRGQRQLESLITQDPSVGIYFADIVQQRPHGTNAALYDLESVQVLKGPQGTLFGRNTTGGAVLFTPNRPTDELGGSVAVTLGNYDLRSATAVLNLPLDETLKVRLAGRITRRDGYVKNLFDGTRTDDERTESGRISVLWEPSPAISNLLVFNIYHQDDAGNGLAVTGIRGPGDPLQPNSPAAQTPGALDAFARQQARDFHEIENNWRPFSKNTAWGLSNVTTIEISDTASLKNIVGYRKVKADNAFDYDGLPVVLFETRNQVDTYQFSEEFQVLGSTMGGRLDYIGGVYFFREKGDDKQSSYLFGPRVNDGTGINESVSAFAQLGFHLTDTLTATGGFRYTIDDRQLQARSTIGSPPLCRLTDANGARLNPCVKNVSTSFESPTWLASLDYKPNRDTLIYVAHRHGYRSGGFNLRSLAPTTFEPFRPEKVDDVELGGKFDMFDGKVRINAAVYKQWYKDIQRTVSFVPIGATATQTTVINAANATIQGGELELLLRPVDLLELSVNGSYTDAKYKNFTDISVINGVPEVNDLSKNKFTAVPKVQLSGYVRLNLLIDPSQGEAGIQLSAYHQSSMQVLDLNPPLPIKAYTLLDLAANWNSIMGSSFDLSLFVKNLANEDYYTSSVSQYGSDARHLALGVQANTIGAPRTFGFELRYRFGGLAN